jgi:hypothetical protein
MSAQLRPESPWGRSVTETQQIPNLLDGGSNPPGLAHASLAQSAEQETLNLGVTGSSPVGGTVDFDSEARVTRNKPRGWDRGDVLYAILFISITICGLFFLLAFFASSQEEAPLPGVRGNVVQDVRIVTDMTESNPTPTRVPCEVGLATVGEPCHYQYPPTPLPVCPPLANGPCIYDGPKSLIPPTPMSGAAVVLPQFDRK